MGSIQSSRENLVVEHYRRRGEFREAVEEVRTYWQIDDPPAQLPPESDDILLPPCLDKPKDLSGLHAVWANHPYLPPLMGGPRDDPASYVVWPAEWSTAYRNLERRWELDLSYALRNGNVPEKYLEDKVPITEGQLPWYRFAAGCVLYDPPEDEENLRLFAEYGGPLPVIGVLTSRRLREQQIDAAVGAAVDKIISDKMWELRRELPDDPDRARFEVVNRFSAELQAEEDRARDDHEIETDLNPPSGFYNIAVDPAKDTKEDVLEKYAKLRAEEGLCPPGGRPRINQLTAIRCAILYDEQNPVDPTDNRRKRWTHERLAKKFGLLVQTGKKCGLPSKRSAQEHVKVGRELRRKT